MPSPLPEDSDDRLAAGGYFYGQGGYGGGYPQQQVARPMGGGRGGRPAANWMPAMGAVAGCPAGLEYLTAVDTIIVDQQIEWLEVMTGYETANRYVLRNGIGQQVYFALEVSSNVQKQFGGKNRAFTMVLVNNLNQQVCRIHRPQVTYMSGGSQAVVEALLGVNIGFIRQHGSGFLVMDATNRPFFQIVAPMIPSGTAPFTVISTTTMMPVGSIVKHYGGAWKEAMTDADTFSVHFPMDLNPQLKATLVAATFLIDFMYFEDTHNDRRNKFR